MTTSRKIYSRTVRNLTARRQIDLPADARIVAIVPEGDNLVVWFESESSAEGAPTELFVVAAADGAGVPEGATFCGAFTWNPSVKNSVFLCYVRSATTARAAA